MAFTVDIPSMGVTATRATLQSSGDQLSMQVGQTTMVASHRYSSSLCCCAVLLLGFLIVKSMNYLCV
jgi:hypothetical protein